MGLFDDALGGVGGKEAFGPADAFAAILLSAVACDGHISDEEVQGLVTVSDRMKLFETIKGNKWNRMMDRLLGILKRSGPDALVEKGAAALPEELKETAFANACELVLADQGIEDEEKEYLSKLQEKLEIDKEQALKIFKVMVIKNSG